MRIQINRTTRRIAGVLLLLLLSVTSYGATAGNIEGTWHGTLKLNAMKLSIVMHFSDNACTLDSPDQGAKGIKGEVREITAEKVDVAFPTLNATYTGMLKDGKIEGTFSSHPSADPATAVPLSDGRSFFREHGGQCVAGGNAHLPCRI